MWATNSNIDREIEDKNLQQRLSRLAPNRSALTASKFKAKDFGAETVTMVSNFE